MISFELKQPQNSKFADELEIYLDHDGLRSLSAQLAFLIEGKTDHIHLMSESWGGSHLSNQAQCPENMPIRHVKILLNRA